MLFLFLFLPILAFANARELCPGIIMHGHEINFSASEKKLACGNPEHVPYKNIPPYQAELFIRGFLQSRGHLKPRFEVLADVLHVHPGKTTLVKSIEVDSGSAKENKKVRDEVSHHFNDLKLTPGTLNKIEEDGLDVVRDRGFPCAKVSSLANSRNGEVDLAFERMVFHQFGDIPRDKVKGLHENAFKRFFPFRSKDPFKASLLELTEKRMLRKEVVSGTYFIENCSVDGEEFKLSQHFIEGPPRTFRYGAGVNTESGVMARVRWAHNRLGNMASQLSGSVEASFRIQAIKLANDQFLWARHARRSLYSQLEFIRETQFDYFQSTARFRPHLKWSEDKKHRGLIYSIGPTFEAATFKVSEDDEKHDYKSVGIEGAMTWLSYNYELFDMLPETGDTFGFTFDVRGPQGGFIDPLLKLDTTVAKLTKIGTWEHGNFILGIRVNGGTTFIPASRSLRDLPPSLKFYSGGSDDVRGFLIRTLPKNNGQGALTRVSSKVELRKTWFFMEALEGFTFVDGAIFGYESWDLRPQIFYSPGAGLRIHTGFGLIQGYWARALRSRPWKDDGNFFFVGLGGSF